MPAHACLCVKKSKDGRLCRRVDFDQPYFADQCDKQLFRFYIDQTKEYFISFELDPRKAYNDYLKTVQTYQAKSHITIERLGEDDVTPYLNRARNATRIITPPAAAAAAASDAQNASSLPLPGRLEKTTRPYFRVNPDAVKDDEGLVETYRYRVKETGNIFESDSLDIYESYKRWYDSLVTYVVDCDCGSDSD